MNRELGSLTCDQNNHLEQVPSAIGPDDQPAVGFLASVFECDCMVDCVDRVLVSDAVLSRRAVNLH